jgi:hypothetical protein
MLGENYYHNLYVNKTRKLIIKYIYNMVKDMKTKAKGKADKKKAVEEKVTKPVKEVKEAEEHVDDSENESENAEEHLKELQGRSRHAQVSRNIEALTNIDKVSIII